MNARSLQVRSTGSPGDRRRRARRQRLGLATGQACGHLCRGRRHPSTAMPPRHRRRPSGDQQSDHTLPADVRGYPEAVASAQPVASSASTDPIRCCSAPTPTALAETSDYGYPVLEHVKGSSKIDHLSPRHRRRLRAHHRGGVSIPTSARMSRSATLATPTPPCACTCRGPHVPPAHHRAPSLAPPAPAQTTWGFHYRARCSTVAPNLSLRIRIRR
jgi:hypothetical protein